MQSSPKRPQGDWEKVPAEAVVLLTAKGNQERKGPAGRINPIVKNAYDLAPKVARDNLEHQS
jgi:hypothetical protein